MAYSKKNVEVCDTSKKYRCNTWPRSLRCSYYSNITNSTRTKSFLSYENIATNDDTIDDLNESNWKNCSKPEPRNNCISGFSICDSTSQKINVSTSMKEVKSNSEISPDHCPINISVISQSTPQTLSTISDSQGSSDCCEIQTKKVSSTISYSQGSSDCCEVQTKKVSSTISDSQGSSDCCEVQTKQVSNLIINHCDSAPQKSNTSSCKYRTLDSDVTSDCCVQSNFKVNNTLKCGLTDQKISTSSSKIETKSNSGLSPNHCQSNCVSNMVCISEGYNSIPPKINLSSSPKHCMLNSDVPLDQIESNIKKNYRSCCVGNNCDSTCSDSTVFPDHSIPNITKECSMDCVLDSCDSTVKKVTTTFHNHRIESNSEVFFNCSNSTSNGSFKDKCNFIPHQINTSPRKDKATSNSEVNVDHNSDFESMCPIDCISNQIDSSPQKMKDFSREHERISKIEVSLKQNIISECLINGFNDEFNPTAHKIKDSSWKHETTSNSEISLELNIIAECPIDCVNDQLDSTLQKRKDSSWKLETTSNSEISLEKNSKAECPIDCVNDQLNSTPQKMKDSSWKHGTTSDSEISLEQNIIAKCPIDCVNDQLNLTPQKSKDSSWKLETTSHSEISLEQNIIAECPIDCVNDQLNLTPQKSKDSSWKLETISNSEISLEQNIIAKCPIDCVNDQLNSTPQKTKDSSWKHGTTSDSGVSLDRSESDFTAKCSSASHAILSDGVGPDSSSTISDRRSSIDSEVVTNDLDNYSLSSEYTVGSSSTYSSPHSGSFDSKVVSSSQLIYLQRPLNLPPKPLKEQEKHKKEYSHMVAVAKKKEEKLEKLRKKQQQERRKEEERKAKDALIWTNEIIPNWATWHKSRKTRSLWWKGLPSSVRGKVWRLAIGNNLNITVQQYNACVKRSHDLLNSGLKSCDSYSGNQEGSVDLICLDISRTFPNLGIFQKGGPYYDMLHNVLAAYVCYQPNVGYMQGMSFIAAMLLLNMEEFHAFTCFANMLEWPCQKAFFGVDVYKMRCYYATYSDLLRANLPVLWQHFSDACLTPDLYLVDWIYTAFSKAINLDVVSRIWDVFIRDGDEFIFQTALGILHMSQDTLLELDFLHAAQYLTKLPDNLCADQLFSSISCVRLSKEQQSFSDILEYYIGSEKAQPAPKARY